MWLADNKAPSENCTVKPKSISANPKSINARWNVTVLGVYLQLSGSDSTSTLNLRRKKEKEEMRRALERSCSRSGPSVLLEGSVLWISLGIASSPVQGLGLAEGYRGSARYMESILADTKAQLSGELRQAREQIDALYAARHSQLRPRQAQEHFTQTSPALHHQAKRTGYGLSPRKAWRPWPLPTHCSAPSIHPE